MPSFNAPRANRAGGGPSTSVEEGRLVVYTIVTIAGQIVKKVLVPVLKRSPIGLAISGIVYLATTDFRREQTFWIADAPQRPLSPEVEVPPMWARDP